MNPLLLLLLAGGGLLAFLSRRTPLTAGGSSLFDSVAGVVSKITQPLGVRNHNPGNLRYIDPATGAIPWDGQVGNDSGYGVYADDARGLRAMAKQVAKHMRSGLNTPTKLIEKYAPRSENPTDEYIANVAGALGVTADHPLTLDRVTLFTLLQAMIRQEQGQAWAAYYSDAQLRAAVNEAFQ